MIIFVGNMEGDSDYTAAVNTSGAMVIRGPLGGQRKFTSKESKDAAVALKMIRDRYDDHECAIVSHFILEQMFNSKSRGKS